MALIAGFPSIDYKKNIDLWYFKQCKNYGWKKNGDSSAQTFSREPSICHPNMWRAESAG